MVTVRQKQKIETRQRLLDSAQRLFAGSGFAATTTLDIAREAGVAHGTVFAHFPTREAMVVEIIQRLSDEVNTRIHRQARQGETVRDVLRTHLTVLQENEMLYTRLITEGHLLPPEGRKALVLMQSAISFHLAGAVAAETAGGSIKPMELHLLFNTWVGLIHHYLVNRDLFSPGGSVLLSHGEIVLNHFMSLITE